MAIVLAHKNQDAGGVSPHTLTITSTATGNLLVVGIVLVDQTKVVSSVVSNGATIKDFVQATSAKATNTAQTLLTDIWYLANADSATSIIITATASLGSAYCYEYSGAATSNAAVFHVAGAASDLAVASTLVGPAITTTTAGEVIFAVVADSNSCTGANAPYATDFLGTANGDGASDHITTTTVSAEKCTFTDSSTGGGCISAAAFNPPASGFAWQQLTAPEQPYIQKNEIVSY